LLVGDSERIGTQVPPAGRQVRWFAPADRRPATFSSMLMVVEPSTDPRFSRCFAVLRRRAASSSFRLGTDVDRALLCRSGARAKNSDEIYHGCPCTCVGT